MLDNCIECEEQLTSGSQSMYTLSDRCYSSYKAYKVGRLAYNIQGRIEV